MIFLAVPGIIVLLHPNPSHFIHNSYVELFAAIAM